MPPNDCVGPYHCHPDRRAKGPEWRDPFKQSFRKAPDAKPQHSLQWGANVDLSTRRSTQSRNMLSNGGQC